MDIKRDIQEVEKFVGAEDLIDDKDCDPEPRWPAIVALIAIGGLYLALPRSLALGPRWLPLAIVAVLLVPTIATHHYGHHRINRVCGFLLVSVITVFMMFSVGLLIAALPHNKETPITLLRSAGALWLTNVLVFASWYWRLDAGGPHMRDERPGHERGSFMFPQMLIAPEDRVRLGVNHWSPNFVDYLFLAFNTSTALSPTDTSVLTRWAKVLMMIQALISLLTIALLAARAVNILS